jgi:hypothetical protein
LSHYYCLEDGASLESFEADLVSARALAEARDIKLSSIVFPRNQYGAEHLEVCHRQGLTHYRGNPGSWAYKPVKGSRQTPLRRALRLADAYSGLLGAQAFPSTEEVPKNVPASRFLRPYAGRLAPLHPRHIATIKHGMTVAAQRGHGYHLWWHPHNFGRNLQENMQSLGQIITHFTMLRQDYDMMSLAMKDFQ